MFQIPDYSRNVSLRLSEVLDDIGVNERIVMKRRRVSMLRERMDNITRRSIGIKETSYCLGSSSEGTTTVGLNSDLDVLTCLYDYNVIQDWSEWKRGMNNLLMIQDETTTPGYCFLQRLRDDEPLPLTFCPNGIYITDRRGRLLLRNILMDAAQLGGQQHGPSFAVSGRNDYTDRDFVSAFPCKSWPRSATGWLERRGIGRWPTHDMKRYAVSNGCFVVPVGSKVSTYRDLEWRISTCLAERCLMFNLNITQIRCYVLTKMALKSFMNPQGENNLSSFMCKTVLLHCIENTESNIWKENNLLTCLTYCLIELYNCIKNDRCSHFIISENNLMAGQFQAEVKHHILVKLSDFIQGDGHSLLQIQTDGLGERFQNKMILYPQCNNDMSYSTENILYQLNYEVSFMISKSHFVHYSNSNTESIIYTIVQKRKNADKLEQKACRLILPLLCTTLGTSIASSSVEQNHTVTPKALEWISAGLNSDVLSSRLKLASVVYSAGYMEKTEFILRHAEEHYKSNEVLPVCSCFYHTQLRVPAEYFRNHFEHNEDNVQIMYAYCVRFWQCELHCVPRELQYEMFRSTQEDLQHRNKNKYLDFWKDWAVVDSLPYLYFLQYKTYGQLQTYQDQQQALVNLVATLETDENLWHRETDLNLLGQCMEQENKPREALRCYMLSLNIRANNNAARFHSCCLIAKCLSQR